MVQSVPLQDFTSAFSQPLKTFQSKLHAVVLDIKQYWNQLDAILQLNSNRSLVQLATSSSTDSLGTLYIKQQTFTRLTKITCTHIGQGCNYYHSLSFNKQKYMESTAINVFSTMEPTLAVYRTASLQRVPRTTYKSLLLSQTFTGHVVAFFLQISPAVWTNIYLVTVEIHLNYRYLPILNLDYPGKNNHFYNFPKKHIYILLSFRICNFIQRS